MSDHNESALLSQLLGEASHCESSLWVIDENCLYASDVHTQIARVSAAISNRFRHWDKGIPAHLLVNDFDFSVLPADQYQSIVYRISKEKILTNHCINASIERLAGGGILTLLGQKQEGIKGYYKRLQELNGLAVSSEKCGAFYRVQIRKQSRTPDILDNADYHQVHQLQREDFTFFSKPGIYGWDKVDQGSQLLAKTARAALADQSTAAKRVLDLGCGYGYLLLSLADTPFKERVATDNNVAAIELCQKNMGDKKLTAECVLDDTGKNLSGRFDLILCNPPFHQGFGQQRQLSERFIQRIKQLMAPKGQCFLVANQFIPVEPLCENAALTSSLLVKESGFKVFEIKHA